MRTPIMKAIIIAILLSSPVLVYAQEKIDRPPQNESSAEDRNSNQKLRLSDNINDHEKSYMRRFSELMYFEKGDFSLHLSGFLTASYTETESAGRDVFSTSLSPIVHLLYKDKWLLEMELEFETDSEPGGIEDELGYLALNYFLNDYVTIQVGKFLSPIGQFRQNQHPSWINKFASAPLGFGHDGAAPISNTGLQLRGVIPLKSTRLNYAFFVVNAPELIAEEGGHGEEEEGGEEDGDHDEEEAVELELNTEANFSTHNKTNQFGGRLGFLPIPNLELGVSYAMAKVRYKNESDRDYEVMGFDFYYRPDFAKDLSLRGEYIRTTLGSGGHSDSSAKELEAYYLQAAYQINSKLEGVLRYGEFNNNGNQSRQIAPGVNYLFASNVILKLGYEFNDNIDDRLTFQLAIGF